MWPDERVRSRLVAERDRWDWPRGARPTPDAKLHVTLHFIGAVEQARLEGVAVALVVPFVPFDLILRRHALWANGIAALEPDRPVEPLAALHRSLASALRSLDLPVEARAHRPHVTLARDARGASVPTEPATLRWRVRGYALVESWPDGAYDVLAAYPPTA